MSGYLCDVHIGRESGPVQEKAKTDVAKPGMQMQASRLLQALQSSAMISETHEFFAQNMRCLLFAGL